MNNQKILIYDIENSPTVVTTWSLWEANAIETLEEWYILSYAYKWFGESKVHVVSLPDFRGYSKDKHNDKKLCESLIKLFDEADVIIAHNGDQHDQKKSNARFIFHGFTPPSPYKSIDTKKVARKYFKFNSNSLSNLGIFFKLGDKLKNEGMHMWRGCMDGDIKMWRKMCTYNKQDVVLLEKIYLRMRPWIKNHPTMSPYGICSNCDSAKLQKRGFSVSRTNTRQRLQCLSCGAWSLAPINK